MIHLVSTPIGNLEDLSIRALRVLKEADTILCEDTRTSKPLLDHYGIDSPLLSFHKFNEKRRMDEVIRMLKDGRKIALISDAGTPSISDPGQVLAQKCREEKIPISAVPGASAPILALTLSGLPTERFQFLGFLPKGAGERKKALLDALYYPGVSLFFESPNRIHQTLGDLEKLGPNHRIAIAREMTKKYEEVLLGSASELQKNEIRGEIVLMIEGHRREEFKGSIPDHVKALQEEFGIEKQEAMKLCASMRGLSKKAVYSCLISEKNL